MDKLFGKLKEYLNMDTEIALEEFMQYYNDVMAELKLSYNIMEEKALLKARYTVLTLKANSEARASRKDKNVKKYKKIAEKTQFWGDSIKLRLKKEHGYTDATLEEADAKIDEEIKKVD